MHHSSRLPMLALSLCLPVLACPAPPVQMDDDDSPNETTTDSVPTPDRTTMPVPDDTTDGTPTPPSNTTGTTAPPGTSDEDGATTFEPPKFDHGIIPEAPILEEDCGKVDFLFVIDNSGSMSGDQANLIANFPGFINGIQNELETVETYQVGVVTTDTYTYNVAGCNQLSSLVVQTGGSNSSGMACGPYAEGNNYMTEMDDLAVTFSCAAQVGTSGSASERPMQAMVEAVQRIEGDPGECNEGFVRDDALLVIIIITDEPDTNSLGTPLTWYDDVLAAKLGIPENVVVVSIINTVGGPCGSQAPQIDMFTDMWAPNSFKVPVCDMDYSTYFNEAIALIDIACENYIPPG